MNIWKILSTISIVLAIGCWFVLATVGFTGNLDGGSLGFSSWVAICFIGFAFFGILSAVFARIGKKMNPLDDHVGSSQGIDSLTPKADSAEPKVEVKTEIKVRCPNCGTLNDENASYCKHCGAHL
jgi:hypothetical protein